MTRRASLPGADELFRANTPALSAVRQVVEEAQEVSKAIGVAPTNPKTKKGVRSTPRRRVTTVDRSPSGREKHDEKITVYLSPDELFDLDQARLTLRGDLGLAVDRGRIVRESIAVIVADLEAKGDQSILARRLRGI
ncbi:hypothetical protein MCEORE3_00708 [Candidatus Nanopelagicaceae bacterium]|jgi:hypothetical protein|uniref:Uncharacterized protein n=1 Tax=Candidatus Planktophila lacus TaxID=1884913 RepID=A0AAD0E3E4_9ACTN|nr:hypothetical protein [Candidatus Planktophila lacus]ASY10594.1 hypothetical protein A1s21148_03455 [Candidatus Planktophila lacus]ASY29012.1 hypothetical protein A1sIIB60_03305 [Candidatus Planktophila lacus]